MRRLRDTPASQPVLSDEPDALVDALNAYACLSVTDAVRRFRWIAADLNASSFGVFLSGPSVERLFLVPWFDSVYPGIAAETKVVASQDGTPIGRHIRKSSQPCWWDDDPAAGLSAAFATLDWCIEIDPLVPANCGVGLPVHGEYGQCGLVVFLGRAMAISPDTIAEAHARSLAVFEAAARSRPGEPGRPPVISRRELECLKLTANGCTSEETARVLKLSVHTANQYLASSTQKLNATNRMHAVAKALRLGLIE